MKMNIPIRLAVTIAIITIAGGLSSSPLSVHAEERIDRPEYDGTGVLDEIRTGSVIINDIYYRLSAEIEFKSPDSQAQTPISFARGDTVGFARDKQGRITVLWRLQKRK